MGQKEGAVCTVGDHRPPLLGKGFFIGPTKFEDVTNDMTIPREEIFGPLLKVLHARMNFGLQPCFCAPKCSFTHSKPLWMAVFLTKNQDDKLGPTP